MVTTLISLVFGSFCIEYFIMFCNQYLHGACLFYMISVLEQSVLDLPIINRTFHVVFLVILVGPMLSA